MSPTFPSRRTEDLMIIFYSSLPLMNPCFKNRLPSIPKRSQISFRIILILALSIPWSQLQIMVHELAMKVHPHNESDAQIITVHFCNQMSSSKQLNLNFIKAES